MWFGELDEVHDLISEAELAIIERSGFGKRIGFGERPAVLVVDVQKSVLGMTKGSTDEYPSGVGHIGHEGVKILAPLLDAARDADVPVLYSRWELRKDQSDIGVYGRKREFLDIDGWAVEGTTGVEWVPSTAPKPQDQVFTKKKSSAFFGTPLISLLVDRGVDTLIVVGGSTSNCIRSTVIDSWSYNYRTMVVKDCVFDRISISHRVALFDMDRQYADVVQSSEVLQYFADLKAGRAQDEAAS